MVQIFLSHSSKQKGYVEIVAEKLGKFNVVYDKWTFETANKTLEEIYHGLDISGVFVYFISVDSVESPWVIKEINKAEEYVKSGKIKKFLPIIIDPIIKHDDSRIPKWIQDEYNIRYISKPTKCSELIKQSLRIVSWDLYPKKRNIDQLFVGRNEQIRQYEERIFDYDKPTPLCPIICGLTSIGRKKFLRHVLVKSNKIREYYSPRTVSLDSRNSIEDLIVKLYGLGYTDKTIEYIADLTSKTIDEKVEIATFLLNEQSLGNDLLFIEDNFCIVGRDGHIVEWFISIINNMRKSSTLICCLISQARVRYSDILKCDLLFNIDIPELEIYERNALFKSLIDFEELELNRDDFKIISDQFTGYPEQIQFTVSLIRQEGVKYVTNNLHEVVDYSTEKIAKITKSFESNQLILQTLKIFSESEFLSLNILEDIMQDDFKEIQKYVTELSDNFLIEFVGNTREYIRLNDSVKDYVQRLGYKLDEKYAANLKTHAIKSFKDYEIIERDTSDYVLSFKEVLKQGQSIPKEFLIPSHYVNAMRELYNYEKRYKTVIALADRILLNERFLDDKIIREIRYWLCSALARRKDKRILSEVQKINGADHNFLLGFYYRIVGRHEDAIIQLKETLEKAPYYYRANRELIQVYLNTEQFNEAFVLARDSYYNDKNNPYNIQSYFRCLLKISGEKEDSELNKLLNGLKQSPHEKAEEMYKTSLAQYYAYIKNNNPLAIQTVDDAISLFPKNIYPYLTKLDILHNRLKDIRIMRDTLQMIEDRFDRESDIFTKLPYLTCQCIVWNDEDKKELINTCLDKEIRANFSQNIYNNLCKELGIDTLC